MVHRTLSGQPSVFAAPANSPIRASDRVRHESHNRIKTPSSESADHAGRSAIGEGGASDALRDFDFQFEFFTLESTPYEQF
jgi:hypothetical protein